MKKSLFLFFSMLVMVFPVSAEKVSLQNAEQLAKNYILSKQKTLRKSGVNLTLKHVAAPVKSGKKMLDETVYYYIFDIDKRGFIIIAGDDVAKPVLGYSESGNYDVDHLPPAFVYWMNFLQSQIAYAQSQDWPQSQEIGKQWETYLKGNISNAGTVVGPLMTTQWGQDTPFNLLCPLDDDTRCLTGCVATAMAQIMNYHKFPQSGIGTGGGYTTPSGINIPAENLEVDYDWDNMLDDYADGAKGTPEQHNAVATLMYHAGLSVNMQYAAGASASFGWLAESRMPLYFGYEKIQKFYDRKEYEAEWDTMIKSQIDAGLPILYGSSGHAFVCDGYDSDGKFHFNFGYAGHLDGFYVATATDLNTDGLNNFGRGQHMTINIKPVQGWLKDMHISAGSLSPKFRPYIFDYKLRVDASVERIDISGITDIPGAIVTGAVADLPLALNDYTDVLIDVSHPDGGNQTYKISILRGEESPFSFLWDMDETKKTPTVGFVTENGKPCSVDWGDGLKDTIVGSNYAVSHEYGAAGSYQVTVHSVEQFPYTPLLVIYKRDTNYPIRDINLRPASRLEDIQISHFGDTLLDFSRQKDIENLMCENGKLTSLDISGLPSLTYLYCRHNQLTDLDVSRNTDLIDLYCGYNAIPLVNLYKLFQQTSGVDYKYLSPQILPDIDAEVGVSIAIDTVFYGTNTQITVSGTDAYTFTNGELTFHSGGVYTVTLTNSAVTDQSGKVQFRQTFAVAWPASVSDVKMDRSLRLYPNPVTNGKFIVETPEYMDDCLSAGAQIQLYDLHGKLVFSVLHQGTPTEINIAHLPDGIYVVKIGEISAKIVKK